MKKIIYIVLAVIAALALAAASSESDIAVDGVIYPAGEAAPGDGAGPAPTPPADKPAPAPSDGPAPAAPSDGPPPTPGKTPAKPDPGPDSNPGSSGASGGGADTPTQYAGVAATAATAAAPAGGSAPATPDGGRIVSRVGSIADRITESVANAGAGLIDIINSGAGAPPLSGEAVPAKAFALLNLAFAAAGAALFACARIYAARRRREGEGYGDEGGRRYALRELPMPIAAALGVALLALTQDVRMPVAPTDRFTILQAAIFAAVAVLFLVSTRGRAGVAGEEEE
jgi:hypothetical protein